MKTFEEFNTRFQNISPFGFYACIDNEGNWFDSAYSFTTAVHWCCCYFGKFSLSTEEELIWMDGMGKENGLAIVHSSVLEKMYYAGLVK